MEPNNERSIIDDTVITEIEKILNTYGVPKDKTGQCYNAIRYQIEARAVLLNRVPDRDNKSVGYYGQYLSDIAKAHGVKYVPDEIYPQVQPRKFILEDSIHGVCKNIKPVAKF